tara:strand:+ start:92 stop:583 length:492 start_codon:yes stop_codon:yes gene_type:complete
MYQLGIPKLHYRRATQVLGWEHDTVINYDSIEQDDGFWLFSFPDSDEYDFKDIVMLLKRNGVSTIGGDTELTERKIMKLTDLLYEHPSPDENNLIDTLKHILESWENPDYRGGVESCQKSDHYFEDIRELIEDYEEEEVMNRPDLSNLNEQQIRKIIRKTIRE